MKPSNHVLGYFTGTTDSRFDPENIHSLKLSDVRECQMAEGEGVYRKMLEILPVAVLIHRKGRIVYANQEAVRLHGMESDSQLVNRFLTDFVHEDDLVQFQKIVLENKANVNKRRFTEVRIISTQNRVIELEVISVPVWFEEKEARLAVCIDRTEQKRIRDSHLDHVAFLNTLIDTIPNPIFYKDRSGAYLGCNKMFAETILGLPRDEIIGKTVHEFPGLIPKEYADSYHHHDRILFEQTGVQVYESKVRCSDGVNRDFIFYKATYKDSQNVTAGLVGVMVDITELRKVEQDLYRYRDQLRGLTSSMTLTEEFERHKIATNLHEKICQALAVSKMKLGALRETTTTKKMLIALDEIRDLIAKTIQDARLLTFELSPPLLYEVGLKGALEWLVEQLAHKGKTVFSYREDGKNPDIDGNISVLLFRATRELLFNVNFHSSATDAMVELSEDDEYVRIRVEDNGVGFDPAKMDRSSCEPAGIGLFSIRERLNHLGGRLEIESKPGEGTKITIISPKKYHQK